MPVLAKIQVQDIASLLPVFMWRDYIPKKKNTILLKV